MPPALDRVQRFSATLWRSVVNPWAWGFQALLGSAAGCTIMTSMVSRSVRSHRRVGLYRFRGSMNRRKREKGFFGWYKGFPKHHFIQIYLRRWMTGLWRLVAKRHRMMHGAAKRRWEERKARRCVCFYSMLKLINLVIKLVVIRLIINKNANYVVKAFDHKLSPDSQESHLEATCFNLFYGYILVFTESP